MNDINASTVDLRERTIVALGTLREGFDAHWWSNQHAANGAICVLNELASEELRAMPKFSEDEAHWLVSHTHGVMEFPSLIGSLLAQSIDDSVPSLGAGDAFYDLIADLTATQDWALRMSLARFHNLRRSNPDVTLESVGFPIRREPMR